MPSLLPMAAAFGSPDKKIAASSYISSWTLNVTHDLDSRNFSRVLVIAHWRWERTCSYCLETVSCKFTCQHDRDKERDIWARITRKWRHQQVEPNLSDYRQRCIHSITLDYLFCHSYQSIFLSIWFSTIVKKFCSLHYTRCGISITSTRCKKLRYPGAML